MSPRLLLALTVVALLGVTTAAAWALTRPGKEPDVPPIRIESPARPAPAEPDENTHRPAPDRHSR